MYSIETRNLTKSFDDLIAVDDVSFTVDDGEIFGFLGPNGAGKSTTIMILTTLLKPTSGSVSIAGFDVRNDAKQVRANIGYVQQDSTVDYHLTGRENLVFQAHLNHIPKHDIESRVDTLIKLIELTDKQHEYVVKYSGGMRKRLDIACGLLHYPKILFLDEPTVGLDIQTRRKIWKYIRRIHEEFNMTIFLTTHYMEEADQLCDHIGIIDDGKIKVIDTPTNMKSNLGNEIIYLTLDSLINIESIILDIESTPNVSRVTRNDVNLTLFVSNGATIVPEIFNIATKHNAKIDSISLTKPTLDDVFLSYTGHEIRDESKKKKIHKISKLKKFMSKYLGLGQFYNHTKPNVSR